jgi:hypothetical protein
MSLAGHEIYPPVARNRHREKYFRVGKHFLTFRAHFLEP